MAWEGMGSWCSKCGKRLSFGWGNGLSSCGCGSSEDISAQQELKRRVTEREFKEWKESRDREEFERSRRKR